MSLDSDTGDFEAIVAYLRQNRGFDFTAYKRISLIRRVVRRMHTIGIDRFDAYLEHLQVHPDEFAVLFNTILINVTTFFRDPEMWDVLRERIVPALIEAREPTDPIRVWSAGCASGQEACSIAMVLAEILGSDAFRERVKIYATDLDSEALAEARRASYTPRQVEDVPPPLLDRYFTRANGSDLYTFDRELRRAMIFGRHDLLSDAPISRVDLLLCRNTLMYFNAAAQARLFERFAFSLNPGGYLVLGRAELLLSHSQSFMPADLKRRIFKGSAKTTLRRQRRTLGDKGREDAWQ